VNDTQRKLARDKAREIMQRMRTDSIFMEQLKSDPRGTLAAAGMPADVLDQAVADLGLGQEDEAAGHARPATRNWSHAAAAHSIWAEALEEEQAKS
jgi:hypothetical protein